MEPTFQSARFNQNPQMPPSFPVQRRRTGLYFLLGLVVILLIIAAIFFYYLTSPISSNSAKKSFIVTSGQGVKVIAANLQEKGFIKSAKVFEIYTYLTGESKKIQAGVYSLAPNMSAKQIASALSVGAKSEYDIKRIPEGSTLEDVANDFYGTNDSPQKQAFVTALAAKAKTFDYFGEKPKVKSLLGYLFPDTYFFDKTAQPSAMIDKILANTAVKITPDIRAQIASQGRNVYDVITLASIVEREVGRNQSTLSVDDLKNLQNEREIVAGIFMNRLAQGMPLQSDATVDFITKKKDPSASAADIQIDSPYNTYKYKGLPPGPISNPSLSSILAAVNYRKTDYLYFLTEKNGTAHFAKTIQEQEQNKQKYLGK